MRLTEFPLAAICKHVNLKVFFFLSLSLARSAADRLQQLYSTFTPHCGFLLAHFLCCYTIEELPTPLPSRSRSLTPLRRSSLRAVNALWPSLTFNSIPASVANCKNADHMPASYMRKEWKRGRMIGERV